MLLTHFKANVKATYILYCVAFFLVCGSFILSHYRFSLPVGSLVIAQYTLLSVCTILAWAYSPTTLSKKSLYIFLGIAITARILLVFIEPYTSNDIDRYLFDGKIALEGLDPYQIPHNHPALTTLKAQWQPPQEHEKYTTLYPPGALALFSLAASTGLDYAHIAWKMITTSASIGLLLLGTKLLININKIRALPFLALSPILLIEPSEAAHIDIFSALSLCAGCYFWQKKQWTLTGIVLGLGVLIKLLPIFALVPLWFFAKGLRHKTLLFVSSVGTMLAGYATAFLLGFVPFGSTQTFFIKWRSGSPIFNTYAHFFEGNTLLIVLFITWFSLLMAIMYFAYTLKDKHITHRTTALVQAIIAAPLLLTPVIFPWYLAPISFLIALRPSVFLLGWTIALPLIYEVLNQFICCGIWKNATWPLVVLSSVFIMVSALAFLPITRNKFNTFFAKKMHEDKPWLM